MTPSIDRHAPRPEFRAALEREIGDGFRSALSLRKMRPIRPPWLRTAAAVLVALGIGVAAGAGSAQVRENQQRARLLEAARAEVLVAERRLELARAAMAEVQQRRRVGLSGPEAIADAEAEVEAMAKALQRIQLNIAEIEASGRSPRDDLAAPPVDERDFVRERLQLELLTAQERLVAAERALREAEVGERLGQREMAQAVEAREEATRARAELELLVGRSALRKEAVERRLASQEVALRATRLEIATRMRMLEELHELSAVQLEEARKRHEMGLLERVELLRIELRAAEEEAELQRLRTELEGL